MNYHANLVTPHPKLQPNATPERFTDVAGLADVPAYLRDAARYGEATYNRALLSAAEHIQWVVRDTLYFKPGTTIQDKKHKTLQTSLNTLETMQTTNCFGFTIAGSEALEQAGIPHVVAYANGHAFSAIVTQEQGVPRLHLADMLSPDLNQDLTAALRTNNAAGIIAQAQDSTHPRGVAKIDTTVLAAQVNSTVEGLAKHPWLSYGRSNTTPHVGMYEDTGARSRYQIVMSAYAPQIGRQVLAQYVDLQAALADKDGDRASVALASMQGLFPDIDARATHPEVRETVKLLQAEGRHSAAARVVKGYTASFYRTADARVAQLEGELLHSIGEAAGRAPKTVARACIAYETALSRSRQPQSASKVRDRLQAARRLLALFESPTITEVENPALA